MLLSPQALPVVSTLFRHLILRETDLDNPEGREGSFFLRECWRVEQETDCIAAIIQLCDSDVADLPRRIAELCDQDVIALRKDLSTVRGFPTSIRGNKFTPYLTTQAQAALASPTDSKPSADAAAIAASYPAPASPLALLEMHWGAIHEPLEEAAAAAAAAAAASCAPPSALHSDLAALDPLLPLLRLVAVARRVAQTAPHVAAADAAALQSGTDAAEAAIAARGAQLRRVAEAVLAKR